MKNRGNCCLTQIAGLYLIPLGLSCSDSGCLNLSEVELSSPDEPLGTNTTVEVLLKRRHPNNIDDNQHWCTKSPQPTLYIRCKNPTRMLCFAFNYGIGSPERDPISWKFEGSNDENEWTCLHEMNDYTWSFRGDGYLDRWHPCN